ncbi:MAG: hypothetical protein FWE32_07430 [Oscillospiraceae bacterium]|nr:hypothetical protein [Oscillospiraceae bacterium]
MKKLLMIIASTMLLFGCYGISEPYQAERSLQTEENILSGQVYETESEVSVENCTVQSIEHQLNENEILIQNIIAREPLYLDNVGLSYYANRFVWWGDSHGFIRDTWEDPSEIDIEQLLYGYELEKFNFGYVIRFSEAYPDINLWPANEVVELVVSQGEAESFITQYVDVDIERLRESFFYDKEMQGYRFRVMDGLGFRSALGVNNVWKSGTYIVIEISVEFENIERYLLIETIDEDRFMFRAYVQLP